MPEARTCPNPHLLATGMEMLMGAVALFIVSVVKGELNGFSFALVSTRSWLGLALSHHVWLAGRVCILWMAAA